MEQLKEIRYIASINPLRLASWLDCEGEWKFTLRVAAWGWRVVGQEAKEPLVFGGGEQGEPSSLILGACWEMQVLSPSADTFRQLLTPTSFVVLIFCPKTPARV